MEEIWKSVKGFEGEYLVSDRGRIMNIHGHIIKTTRDKSNNLVVSLKGKHVRVAYAVAHAFVPNPNGYAYQGYKDGNKANCCADNIEWIIPDFSNDGQAIAVVLVKEDCIYEFGSIEATARFLNTGRESVKGAANNQIWNIRLNGYFVAWANDDERIAKLLEGVECVKSLEGEEWRDLPELQGEYQVSNLGRVKRIKGVEKLRKITIQKNKHAYVSLSFGNTTKTLKVSRLVAKAFIPNPNNYEEVDHINADKTNNTVSNLDWVTPEENKRRAYVNNLYHKWTDEEKEQIRARVKAYNEKKKRLA